MIKQDEKHLNEYLAHFQELESRCTNHDMIDLIQENLDMGESENFLILLVEKYRELMKEKKNHILVMSNKEFKETYESVEDK